MLGKQLRRFGKFVLVGAAAVALGMPLCAQNAYALGVTQKSCVQPASIAVGKVKHFAGKYAYDSTIGIAPIPSVAQISIEVPTLCSASLVASSDFSDHWYGTGTGGMTKKKVHYFTGRKNFAGSTTLELDVKAKGKKAETSKSYVGTGKFDGSDYLQTTYGVVKKLTVKK